ncbi:MAG: mechanosensitive ion channel [Dehalococcoidales bacterium]|nr:mechanosensitive ion channel [Dehalococcoidales bacterium]
MLGDIWDWFTVNSIWFLTGAALLFIPALFSRNILRDRFSKLKPEKRDTPGKRIINRILIAAIYISTAFILASLIAIIVPKEGIFSTITAETIQEWLLSHGIVILAYIVIFYFLYRIIKALIPRMIIRFVKSSGRGRHSKSWFERRAKTLTDLIVWIIAIVTGLITFFLILAELNRNITPLLASAGIVGVALALGAQSIVKDFLVGIFILLEDQYNKGDVIKIAGISGEVVEINLRRTVLRDLDGIVHSIPNSSITTASNYTRDWARVNLDIPVAYGEDLDKVFTVINRVGNKLAQDEYFSKLIKTPPQVLRVQKFGDSGIDIRILGDVHPMMQWEVTGELRKRLKKAFDEEGIEIPWPHVKLYLGGNKEENNLICSTCSHVNPKGNKFCAECGGKLQE